MSPHPSERQRAMLAEMGIKLWAPPAALAPATTSPAAPVAAPKAAPGAAPIAPVTPVVTAPIPATPVAQAATPPPPAPAPASPVVAVDTLDWPGLQAAVSACRACGLCEGRTQTVFGAGAPTADWLVVGEAPGEQEDLQGQPFVGPAGQLLDHMLAAIGLSRQAGLEAAPDAAPSARQLWTAGARQPPQSVYIANVLKCRPPGNRNPQPEEMARCEPYLRRQVALLQPKIILALGRFAVQSLLGSTEPIGRLRGRVHHYQGVPVIVSYHPAYLLRALPEKAKAWQDLCLALAVSQGQDAPESIA